LVLDVLKPHSPSMLELAEYLGQLDGVDGVDISLVELDKIVENVKITVEGSNIIYEEIERVIAENGGSIHSIDKVSTGKRIVEEAETMQDP